MKNAMSKQLESEEALKPLVQITSGQSLGAKRKEETHRRVAQAQQ
jgi:hypothetical protein